MARAMHNLPGVEPFIVGDSVSTNLDKKWINWMEDFNIYIMATGVSQDQQKKALLLHLAGKEVKEIYKTVKEDNDNYEKFCEKLNNHFQPKKNITYERYMFKQASQYKEESSINYVTRLRGLVETCNFPDVADAVKDQFISSCKSIKLKKILLQEEKLTLEKCIQKARDIELAKAQADEMVKKISTKTDDGELVNYNRSNQNRQKVYNHSSNFNRSNQNRQNPSTSHNRNFQNSNRNFQNNNRNQNNSRHRNNQSSNSKSCFRCGEKFSKGHNLVCRANGRVCYRCDKKNHLASCCKSKNSEQANDIFDVSNSTEEESETEELFSIEANQMNNKNPKLKNVVVKVENVDVSMIIDSGSSVNIIDTGTFRKIQKKNKIVLKPSKTKIYPYASEPIKTLGYFQALFENKNLFVTQKLFVVDKSRAGNLIGLETAKALNVICVNKENLLINSTHAAESHSNNKTPIIDVNRSEEFHNSVNTLINEFEDVFKGHGKLKNFECKLYVDEKVTPVAQKLRRYPYHLRKAIKEELKRLEKEDIIEKVNGPQEWISNLVVVQKKHGKIRLCLDARVINTAIKREKHPIPTLDSIIDDMHGAKIFAKLDMKEAYTQIVLEENSRNITSFNTHEGVYRNKRLVYGINNAFEIFQKTMEQSFGEIRGVKLISDDIIIFAKDKEELLQRLRIILLKVRSLGLKLNKSKCIFGQSKIKFFGIEISEKGISPDPDKITAIKNAQAPRSVNELRSFLGLCTYVSRFIDSFSEKTTVLRELLKQNVKFEWNDDHEQAFSVLKNELSSESLLAFYNPQEDIRLVTDASGHALGAVLLQKENDVYRPIYYVSRTLKPSELNYSVIEKEALALVWAVEKFHLYLFGKKFEVVVDHKPLKFIFQPQQGRRRGFNIGGA